MADTEVQVGDKVIGENTKVTVTIKVLVMIIGGLITLFSTLFSLAYFDLKSELEENKKMFSKEKTEYTETVSKELNQIVDKLREKDELFLRDIGDIKGNIKVILDRTSTYRTSVPSSAPFENNLPESDDGFANNLPE